MIEPTEIAAKHYTILYVNALAADERFTAELTRVYGKQACNRRYQLAPHADAAVQAALLDKIAADDAWIASLASRLAAK